VSIDLCRSELLTEVTCKSAKHSDSLKAYFLPKSVRGTSIQPVIVPARLPYDSQFLTNISLRGALTVKNLVSPS